MNTDANGPLIPEDYIDLCPYCDGQAESVGSLPGASRTWFDCQDCGTLYARDNRELRYLIGDQDPPPLPPSGRPQ